MFFLVLLFVLPACGDSDPAPEIHNDEKPLWKIYTNINDIITLLLSDDGETLWVGTQGGLEKRDSDNGKHIQVFTKVDGLPENHITSLVSDGSGGLWIGTDGGGLAYLIYN
ncbi:MAG: two-component regulator propeller domain-containing protein [Thermodesulfobacteriota bacterium]